MWLGSSRSEVQAVENPAAVMAAMSFSVASFPAKGRTQHEPGTSFPSATPIE